MAAGRISAGEGRRFRDEGTGAALRQVTDAKCINHHPFYYLPCMDNAMGWLIFVSHRTGRPEIFGEEQATGSIVRMTDHEGIGEWSVHPSPDGRHVYFTAQGGGWRVDTATQREELLADFRTDARGKGMVGAGMGTTSLSHDGRYWAVPLQAGPRRMRLAVVDTETGDWENVVEHETVGHPQFHPEDSSLLRFAGNHTERVWIVRRNGTGKRLVYRRKPYGDGKHFQWIVHETWRPGSHEIITANWPHGCIGIDVDTGNVRNVCSFNAWHPAIAPQGTTMCADTVFPDRGLMLFHVLDGKGVPRPLCTSASSSVGAHWETQYCPYDDGPIQVYAPQHTHPHPSFTPDGRSVVFTSDRTGHAQVYRVELPEP